MTNLFDSSLTNDDPSLAALRARAAAIEFDGTASVGRVVASAGISTAGDENIGEYRTTSIARIHGRLLVGTSARIGVQMARAIGGSVRRGEGRLGIDIEFRHQGQFVTVEGAVGTLWGKVWRMAEISGGQAARFGATIGSVLQAEIGLGRYSTTFGERRIEWDRAFGASILVGRYKLGFRYAATLLGAGTGTSVSLGYEADDRSCRSTRC